MSIFTDAVSDGASKKRTSFNFTIPINGTMSNQVFLGYGNCAIGLFTASNWNVGTLEFSSSLDGNSWFPVHMDSGPVYSFSSPTGNTAVPLSQIVMLPWRWLQIRSGSILVPVVQTDWRYMVVVCKSKQ
jgi:hypothetical protein